MKGWIAQNFGPAGAAKLAARQTREVFDRLKRLPQIMDDVEHFLQTERYRNSTATVQNRPPWWAWFSLVIILASVAGLTIAQFA